MTTTPTSSSATAPTGRGGPLVPVVTTVTAVRTELADTVTLTVAGHPDLPTPAPGQFAMLWAPGVGEVPISYSAIGPGPAAGHTIRAVGATTRRLASLRPGDRIGLRGPFGHGWDLSDLSGRQLLVVAGGLGLAPLRPVIDAAAAGSLDSASTRVAVGARSPDELLWHDEVAATWGDLELHPTVDRPDGAWHGFVGPVTTVLDGLLDDPAATTALICGPEIMLRVVAARLVGAGVAAPRIQVSIERNMHCGVRLCGHCQLGPLLACADGPVVRWDQVRDLLAVRER